MLMPLAAGPVVAQTPLTTQKMNAPSLTDRLVEGFSGHVNVGYQGGSTRQADAFSYRAYGEDSRFISSYANTSGVMLDAGGSFSVWRELAVRASYTQLNKSSNMTVTGTVPHPLEFNEPRTIQPQSRILASLERGTHVGAEWRFPVRQVEGLDVGVFGGPSFFNVRQEAVVNVTVQETVGSALTGVTVKQVQTAEYRRNGIGAHFGADATYMHTTYVGVGFFVRFTAVSVDLPSADSGTLSLDAGGIQMGGGGVSAFDFEGVSWPAKT